MAGRRRDGQRGASGRSAATIRYDMVRPLLVVGLGGSLAKVSRSRAALATALEGAASAGAETELLDLRELESPMYDPDDNAPTAGTKRLIESCYAADGMLWASPMYQGTISGAFKNALDWLHLLGDRDPAYLHDKVIGLISTAVGTQGLQAINTMEFSVRALRAWAVPYVVPVASAPRVFDIDGTIRDEGIARQLKTLGHEVVRVAKRFASDSSVHHQTECEKAAERVAAASQQEDAP
jgi:FMN reductase